MVDPFDLNTLSFDHEFRLYAGLRADIECVVDEEDYLHFSQWLWEPLRNKNKIYFRRTQTIRGEGGRISPTKYLHIEILTRSKGPAPTKRRSICDHLDGNSLNCRRNNLRWATRLENNRNRFGIAYYQREIHV